MKNGAILTIFKKEIARFFKVELKSNRKRYRRHLARVIILVALYLRKCLSAHVRALVYLRICKSSLVYILEKCVCKAVLKDKFLGHSCATN